MCIHDLKLLATDDGSYTLYDSTLEESYHSKFGAQSESDQVFLHNSGVAARLLREQPTSVLEIGFGTGFNFVRTALSAIDSRCPLEYTAIEMQPLPAETVLTLLQKNATGDALSHFTAAALKQTNVSNDYLSTFDQLVTLELIKSDAIQWKYPSARYDAIYLDAFSKKNNPALWQPAFLKNLKQSLLPTGTLATYCVNRSFRDALTDTGWLWQKLPGPKGKREVLTASHALGGN